jgi:peptidoglycan/xylan/chitin deacetylase (PgdA/CDA1 family)
MNYKKIIYESFHRPRRVLLNQFDHPALILLYHRVTTLSTDPQQLAVTPENFHRQIKYLKDTYNVLSIDEFVGIVGRKEQFPKHSIVITFDDGYADNFLEAVPILESLNAEAIFYITTSLIGTRKEFWWDDLERLLLLPERLPSTLTITIRGLNHTFSMQSLQERREAYHALHIFLKYTHPEERERVLASIREWADQSVEGRSTHRVMTVEELRQMASSHSAIIGAHTDSHTPLSIMTLQDQQEDIQKSVDKLQSITMKKMEHFSYPFGLKKDYNADTLGIVRELKFKMVCSNYYDHVHRWSNRYELPRIIVRNWEISYFQQALQHFFRY